MPSAPEPANRSRTRASGSAVPTMLIHASRTRSAVGRTASPGGALMVRPRQRPATIRTRLVPSCRHAAHVGELRDEAADAVPLVALEAERDVHTVAVAE